MSLFFLPFYPILKTKTRHCEVPYLKCIWVKTGGSWFFHLIFWEFSKLCLYSTTCCGNMKVTFGNAKTGEHGRFHHMSKRASSSNKTECGLFSQTTTTMKWFLVRYNTSSQLLSTKVCRAPYIPIGSQAATHKDHVNRPVIKRGRWPSLARKNVPRVSKWKIFETKTYLLP